METHREMAGNVKGHLRVNDRELKMRPVSTVEFFTRHIQQF